MKVTSTAVHAGLATVALVAAYATWQREPEATGESVIVFDAARKELQVVRYEDPARWIEFRPTEEGEGVWVKIGQKDLPAPAVADAGVNGAGGIAGGKGDGGTGNRGTLDGGAVDARTPDAGTGPLKPPDRELRGNEFAEKLFKKFAPLRAARALGVVEESKLNELGLKTPLRSLEVKTRGGGQKYDVGASGLGLSSPYLRSQDGKVFLLGGGIVSEFDMGQGRLVDRDLHDFTAADYDELKVTAGASREFVLLRGATAAQNSFAAKESPTAPDEFVKNWHDKVWRGYAAELYGRGEALPEEAPPMFRIDYLRKGSTIGFLEVSASVAAVYARTEHTAGWVKFQAAEGIWIEAKRVVEKDRK